MSLSAQEEKLFESWFNASKYMQVVYSPESKQPCKDGWQACLSAPRGSEAVGSVCLGVDGLFAVLFGDDCKAGDKLYTHSDSAEVEALRAEINRLIGAVAEHATVRSNYFSQIADLQEKLSEAEGKLREAETRFLVTVKTGAPVEAQLSQRQQGVPEAIECLQKISEFCPPDPTVDYNGGTPEMDLRLHNAEIGDTARAALSYLTPPVEPVKEGEG